MRTRGSSKRREGASPTTATLSEPPMKEGVARRRAVRWTIVSGAAAVAIALPLLISVAPGDVSAASATINKVTFTAPTGASLDNPAGVATNNNGTVFASNSADNVVASIVGTTTQRIAGSYEAIGETGDGGAATSATLAEPDGLVADHAGNVYVADTEDNTVREILASGDIELIAGNGTPGYRGDGGEATKAELDAPQGVAVNAQGDVFIADADNNVVREVTTAGKISTFAGNGTAGYSGDGGQATEAQLTTPTYVAVDALGDVYISDTGNNVIRRVSTSGVITTVAGDYTADQANDGVGGLSGDGGPATSAQLNTPEGIALDQAGDLFIADTFNNAIREVVPNTSGPGATITTLVDTAGAKGSSGNGGPAATAKLNTPEAVAVDNSTGDVYIADTSNNQIRVVTGLPVPGGPAGGPTAP